MTCHRYFNNGTRCNRRAEVWLFTPDGKQCPGGFYCRKHADETVIEYQEKLGEFWTYKPINEYGDVDNDTLEYARPKEKKE